MRSAREILFRLGQESGNLRLLAFPPAPGPGVAALPALPDPACAVARAANTAYAAGLEQLADMVLEHRLPALGQTIDAGPQISWRRDYTRGIESPLRYFRLLPYLDAARVGDHKFIWEINRHQHLVLLAQAYRLTGRREFRDELACQWHGWVGANPFMRGINWASALEVAFRALSWIWVYHLAGAELGADFGRRFAVELYRHGCYLERNLSIYFSPNTHLLGEAVALHAIGTLFPAFPGARRWTETGARLVAEQMEKQVRADGSHFEQSAWYHVYALDFFLLHHLLSGGTSEAYRARMARMGDFLHCLLGPARILPLLGDDDGGRLFHPYGRRELFGRASLAAGAAVLGRPEWLADRDDLLAQAAWWMGPRAFSVSPAAAPPPSSRYFPDAGVAVLASGEVHAVIDAGPMAPGGAGHSHADALSLVVRCGGEEILTDSGTFTYVGDAALRNWFRGSAAHNTVRIDGLDQARPGGPFRWTEKPEMHLLEWSSSPEADCLDAVCRYAGFSHRRRIEFHKPHILFIFDEVGGPEGLHRLEQFWHPGCEAAEVTPACFRIGSRARLFTCRDARLAEGGEHGRRSRSFGQQESAPVISMSVSAALPVRFGTVLDLSGGAQPARASLRVDADKTVLVFEDGAGCPSACFPHHDGTLYQSRSGMSPGL